MESTLNAQPLEILHKIGEHLSLEDVRHLRLACSNLSLAYAHALLKSVVIDFRRGPLDKELSKLRRLASGNSAASKVTHNVHLLDLSLPNAKSEDAGTEYNTIEVEVKHIFGIALNSLKKVQCLVWSPPIAKDNQWLYDVMETFIRGCREQLLEVHLLRTSPGPVVPFHDLKKLRCVTLEKWGPQNGDPILDDFSAAVKNGDLRQLEVITIKQRPCWPTGGGEDVLDKILRNYPASLPPLRLRDLSLDYVPNFPCGTHSLLHLRWLTSLKLVMASTSASLQKEVDRLWSSFQQAGIQLQNLETNMFSTSLVQYFRSYSDTLKVFKLIPEIVFGSRFNWGRAGDVFESLVGHSSSLKVLSLRYGGWALCPNDAQMLLRLTQLNWLSIGIVGAFFNGERLRTGNLPLAMDAALALAHLQEFIPFFCDLDDMHKASPINDALRIFVRNFRHPITSREPPVISYHSCNEQTFAPVQDVSGKFWVYSGDKLGEEFDETTYTTDEDWPDNFNPVEFFWDQLGGDHGSEVVNPVSTDSEEESDN